MQAPSSLPLPKDHPSETLTPAPKATPKRAAATRKTLVAQPLEDDDDLNTEYELLLAEDAGVRDEALNAYKEMEAVPFDDLDKAPTAGPITDGGTVSRRAPLNPLASPKLGKYRIGQTKEPKVEDPALQANPLRGRLVACLNTSFILIFVFFQSLVYNYITTGKALVPSSANSMYGPSGETLEILGGLNTNAIRRGETVRIFWAMWMHSGFLHILLNVVSQLQFFYMFEPDWGFWRCLILFWISGISGNLLSASMDPCSVTVGSSGGLYGLMGAMLVYCMEYWNSIPRPGCIVAFTLVVLIISFMTGFTGNTDNWAHLGGLIGGLLFSFGTVTTLSFAAFCRKDKMAAGQSTGGDTTVNVKGARVRKKKPLKRAKAATQIQKEIPNCRMAKAEWIVRIVSWLGIILYLFLTIWILLVKYQFTPPGHVSFSGTSSCCCCFIKEPHIRANWFCSLCEVPPPPAAASTGNEDFGTFCSRTKRRLLLEDAYEPIESPANPILHSTSSAPTRKFVPPQMLTSIQRKPVL